MNSMDAQMVALHSADESALAGRLCDALDGEPGYKEAPEGTQTAIIMSGMYTSEVQLHGPLNYSNFHLSSTSPPGFIVYCNI